MTPLSWRAALFLACAPLFLTGKATLTGAVYGGIDILYDAPPFEAHRQEFGIAPAKTAALGDVVYQR